MIADKVVFYYTKKFKKTSKVYICVVSKRKGDLKMIHDENDMLTDNELVVARDFSKKSKHACLYIQKEFPREFRLLNHA